MTQCRIRRVDGCERTIWTKALISRDAGGQVEHTELDESQPAEYGPSLYEFDRTGQFIRAFAIPAGLIPRNATTSVANFASDTGVLPG